jgi:molybdenum cofactor cytidylyltransferase
VTAPKVAAVVLAAGLSTRMPANKLLADLNGKPVVRHVAEAALGSRASSVIVVVGHAAPDVRAALHGLELTIVENREFAKGLSESLKCGVRNVPAGMDGVLILLGDMPFVLIDQINALIEVFDPEAGRAVCVPVRNGRRGNPVLWSRRFFPELLELEGDAGAKRLMACHEDVLYEVEMGDDGALIDIDTLEDLKRHE